VPEQLALDEVLGQGGAVELDERLVAAAAPSVDRARDELLADAGLAGDEDRCVGRRDLARHPHGALHLGVGGALDQLARVAVARDLERQQPILLAQATVGAIQHRRLLRRAHGECNDLSVDGREIEDGLRIRAALHAVERHGAERAIAREQRHDHARMPVRQIHDAVVGIAIAVRVIMSEHRARPPRLERAPHAREVGQRDAVAADLRVRERSTSAADGELVATQLEHGRKVVRNHFRQRVEGSREQVVDARGLAREQGDFVELGGQIQRVERHCVLLVPTFRCFAIIPAGRYSPAERCGFGPGRLI
jgi:hypothetical protein